MGLPKKKESSGPTKAKAKEMLKHGTVRGKPLSGKQRGLMGVIAAGKKGKY